jgi:hypothetical protein
MRPAGFQPSLPFCAPELSLRTALLFVGGRRLFSFEKDNHETISF